MTIVKVVFHIDEVEKWPLLLANVSNLAKVVDVEKSDILVLVNSKAVMVFDGKTQPNHQDLIEELTHKSVQFCVCQNSLQAMNIVPDLLPSMVNIVPVGVLALIEKQVDGFAYIKP